MAVFGGRTSFDPENGHRLFQVDFQQHVIDHLRKCPKNMVIQANMAKCRGLTKQNKGCQGSNTVFSKNTFQVSGVGSPKTSSMSCIDEELEPAWSSENTSSEPYSLDMR